MINTEGIIGGAKIKMAPLISFDTIIDSDFGLINILYMFYNDKTVFTNQGFFDLEVKDLLKKLYLRKEKNLLYLLSDYDKKELDNFYNEFLDTKLKEIYDKSISTNMISLIESFKNSADMDITILCYNEEQLKVLESEDELNNINKVLLSSLREKDKEKFTQFFFKDTEEAIPFSDLRFKTFYFSIFGPNFNEESNDFLNEELIYKLIKNKNQISIFSYYNENILGKE